MKVKVDSNKCIGCGNCVAISESQIFDFNDEGLAETIIDEINEDIYKIDFFPHAPRVCNLRNRPGEVQVLKLRCVPGAEKA